MGEFENEQLVARKVLESIEKGERVDASKGVQVEGRDFSSISSDLGRLSAYDYLPLNIQSKKGRKPALNEQILEDRARDSVQLMFNSLFSLPIERKPGEGGGVFALLPPPTTTLPRSHSLPKEKTLTRWERFSREKGLIGNRNERKERYVQDKETGEEKPRWGYKRANDPESSWIIEGSGGGDSEDPFIEKRREKKRKILDQKKREQRNIRASNKDSFSSVQLRSRPSQSSIDKKQSIEKKLSTAQTATSSLGRFDKKLEGEGKIKRKERKTDSLGLGAERELSTKILQRVLNKTKNRDEVIKPDTKKRKR